MGPRQQHCPRLLLTVLAIYKSQGIPWNFNPVVVDVTITRDLEIFGGSTALIHHDKGIESVWLTSHKATPISLQLKSMRHKLRSERFGYCSFNFIHVVLFVLNSQ